MIGSVAQPHFLQGPENFPSEQMLQHISGLAKNGASAVVFTDWTDPHQRTEGTPDGKHFPMYDLSDPSVLNYISQLADGVHYYNSKISIQPNFLGPQGVYLTDEPAAAPAAALAGAPTSPAMRRRLMSGDFAPWRALTAQEIEQLAEDMAERVLFYKHLGFDMCTIHMAYSMSLLGQFLSPLSNFRTDEFGGSLENRARYPLMACRRIKEKCGEDFLVEVEVSGEEKGGMTTGDVIAFGRLAEGLIDIFQVRDYDADISQPTGYYSSPDCPATLRYAEKMKQAGIPQVIEVVGGYHDVAQNERYLAEGKTDLIGLARSFLCEPDYLKKVREGRGEDVAPCIRCNRCHTGSYDGGWLDVCSVNPAMGFAHKLDKMNPPPERGKRVAVVGGGPAGMRAALVAAQRGHRVTLFEKSDVLGGQLIHADYPDFKWPLKRYKDWLIAQVKKAGVELRMNTEATAEMIRDGGYDAVLAATGAVPKFPAIPGADAAGVHTPISVYGHEGELGKRVVVVGGSETGMETAYYLARCGHEATVLSRQKDLMPDAAPVHFRVPVLRTMLEHPNLTAVPEAKTTALAPGRVTYRDSAGTEHVLSCDDIVLCGGVRPLQDEALAFYNAAPEFDFIGDCRSPGNLQTCNRHAFAAASQL